MRFLLRLPCLAMPFQRLLALSILIALSGCFDLPIPHDSDPFTDSNLAFIEMGKTTKEEIRLTLAEPPFEIEPREFHGGKLWLYSKKFADWGADKCVGWFGEFGECLYNRGDKNYLLLLRFDEQGIIDYRFDAEGPRFSVLAIAVIADFDLELQEDGFNFLTRDGLTVEARRLTDVDEVNFYGNEEMLLVVKRDPGGSWRKIYFGGVKPARDAGSKLDGGSSYLVDASTLEELNAARPSGD
jgi:hypothetical protein